MRERERTRRTVKARIFQGRENFPPSNGCSLVFCFLPFSGGGLQYPTHDPLPVWLRLKINEQIFTTVGVFGEGIEEAERKEKSGELRKEGGGFGLGERVAGEGEGDEEVGGRGVGGGGGTRRRSLKGEKRERERMGRVCVRKRKKRGREGGREGGGREGEGGRE